MCFPHISLEYVTLSYIEKEEDIKIPKVYLFAYNYKLLALEGLLKIIYSEASFYRWENRIRGPRKEESLDKGRSKCENQEAKGGILYLRKKNNSICLQYRVWEKEDSQEVSH